MKNKHSKKRLYFFIGTTAEFIKLAPIMKELNYRGVKYKVILSGQNKIYFDDLEGYIGQIRSQIVINEKQDKSSVPIFLLWVIKTFFIGLKKLKQEFKGLDKNNSYFIVHGDTVSSLIGALIAFIYRLKLVHVECGEISRNFLEPFPEEICKNITMRLADVLFPQNKRAEANLTDLKGVKINTYYNTLIESFSWAIKLKSKLKNQSRKKYYILIMHRQEHVVFRKSWTRKILKFILDNSRKDLECVLFAHPLAVDIIKSLDNQNIMKNRIRQVERVKYVDFMRLLHNAEFIATDSCTSQLESFYCGTPCLVLRDFTEQMDGVGKNVVICKSDETVMKKFLNNYSKYRKKVVMSKIKPSKIIVDYLINH